MIIFKKNFFIIILVLILLTFIFFINKQKIEINIEDVFSIKIEKPEILYLKKLSDFHNLNFTNILSIYSIEKTKNPNIKINNDLILNYKNIKKKYRKKTIDICEEIYTKILNDVKAFPLDKTNKDYSYTNNWGEKRTYGGNRLHKGIDIFNTNNIRGETKIISMTNGIIENIGWNEKGGYRVGIRTNNDNYYYYAHLDSIKKDLKKGDIVLNGDFLGYMGDSGYSKIEGTKGKFPVHLHLGIEVKINNKAFWVNPFIFLVLME